MTYYIVKNGKYEIVDKWDQESISDKSITLGLIVSGWEIVNGEIKRVEA